MKKYALDLKMLKSNTKEALPGKQLGRPLLEEERVPFTTSLTRENAKALKQSALDKECRPADLLNEILTIYFFESNH